MGKITTLQTGVRAVETLKESVVRIRVLRPKFRIGGRRAEIGEEHEIPVADARELHQRGHLEILPGTARLVDTGVRTEDPRAGTRWSVTQW